jgi:hypothetical protein
MSATHEERMEGCSAYAESFGRSEALARAEADWQRWLAGRNRMVNGRTGLIAAIDRESFIAGHLRGAGFGE